MVECLSSPPEADLGISLKHSIILPLGAIIKIQEARLDPQAPLSIFSTPFPQKITSELF
jgi:hypothetical protein